MKIFYPIIYGHLWKIKSNQDELHDMMTYLEPYKVTSNLFGLYIVLTDKQFTFFILKWGSLIRGIDFIKNHRFPRNYSS